MGSLWAMVRGFHSRGRLCYMFLPGGSRTNRMRPFVPAGTCFVSYPCSALCHAVAAAEGIPDVESLEDTVFLQTQADIQIGSDSPYAVN